MADDGTFCTTAEVSRKAGENASATSNAEAYINQYVQEVEGFIMMITRYDFKTNYAGLDSFTKELLREATSNLAAVYVIQFDMFGYTQLDEAENMINILWTRFWEAMGILTDSNTKEFIGI